MLKYKESSPFFVVITFLVIFLVVRGVGDATKNGEVEVQLEKRENHSTLKPSRNTPLFSCALIPQAFAACPTVVRA